MPNQEMYSPHIDVAVCPLETGAGHRNIEFDRLMDQSRQFINEIVKKHVDNIRKSDDHDSTLSFEQLKLKNRNARCLLAIEIENRGSRKHIMGGAINAASLGRIGIAVAWTPKKLEAFIKLHRYLRFLSSDGNITFDTTNLLILDHEQLRQAIQNAP